MVGLLVCGSIGLGLIVPATAQAQAKRLQMFATQTMADGRNRIVTRSTTDSGATWSGIETFNCDCVGTTTASDRPGHLLMMTLQRTSRDLVYFEYTNGLWSSAQVLERGGRVTIGARTYTFQSSPAIASWGPDRLSTFARRGPAVCGRSGASAGGVSARIDLMRQG
jgi:hypothetical protein